MKNLLFATGILIILASWPFKPTPVIEMASKASCVLVGQTPTITNTTTCQIFVSWPATVGTDHYILRHKIAGGTGDFIAKTNVGNVTSGIITIGLSPGVKYTVSVVPYCTSGTGSGGVPSVGVSATLPTCSPPVNIQTTGVTENSAIIGWTPVCNLLIYVRYRVTGTLSWTTLSSTTGNLSLMNLLAGTTYEYQLNSCDTSVSTFWTLVQNFTTGSSVPPPTFKPYIVVIQLDDARFDQFKVNNGPAYFESPNIDRIANEGANFKKAVSAHSLCAPSRTSCWTGRYSFKHGVTNNHNQTSRDMSLPTVPGILKTNGYWTMFVGKSHKTIKYSEGVFNKWLEIFPDGKYQPNDKPKKVIAGYSIDVLTDTVVQAIHDRADAGQFYIHLAVENPHDPADAAPQFYDYGGHPAPLLPSDTLAYQNNYPSYLDILPPGKNYAKGTEKDEKWAGELAEIAQVDSAIGRIYQALLEEGILDSTMIIFTSDNGHLRGEKGGLDLKRLFIRGSSELPLFIRYPLWFPENTIVNTITNNLDIPVTILDAAGISNTFSMDGLSLYDIYTGDTVREFSYYHYIYDTTDGYPDLPGIWGVKSLEYKYTFHGCQSLTEEFFDLVNDSLENTNQINNPAYASLIETYREQLSLMREEIGDTLDGTFINCYLKNPTVKKGIIVDENDVSVYPNPSAEKVFIKGVKENELIELYSSEGQYLETFRGTSFDMSHLPDGKYYLRLQKTGVTKEFVKVR